MPRIDKWLSEVPRPPSAEIACRLARDRFWKDGLLRLVVWSRHAGDPILESNLTRRVDFALFMVEALQNDGLVHEAPAIVSRQAPSALAHAAGH